MPGARDSLHAEWPGGDQEAMRCLRNGGWRLRSGWCWAHPDDREPTERERSAAQYMCDEWDFGVFVRWDGSGRVWPKEQR